jgi:Flp pilus assembly protein TadG
MLLGKPRHARRSGTATVEFALVMMFLLPPMVIGLIEVGRMVEVQQILSNAAREGARHASTAQYTNNQCRDLVKAYLLAANIPITNATVYVSDLGSTTTLGTPPFNSTAAQAGDQGDVTQAKHLDVVYVYLTVPYSDVRWINLNLATSSTTTLSAQSTWISGVDKPYGGTADAPTG